MEDGDFVSGLYRPYQLYTAKWLAINELNLKTGDIEGVLNQL